MFENCFSSDVRHRLWEIWSERGPNIPQMVVCRWQKWIFKHALAQRITTIYC